MTTNTIPTKVSFSKIRLVEIEVFSYCNRKCWFCPNSFIDRHSKNTLMEENLYLGVLNELKSIDYSNMITYSRYNEPLSHKDIFIKRLKQARELVPKALLHTNTNGDYLTREYLDELYDAGLRSLNIQSYLNENEPFEIANIEKKFAKTAEKLILNYKITLDSEDWYCIAFDYKDMKLNMTIRDFKANGTNRGDTLKIVSPIVRPTPCFVPFTDIYIDYNGNVMPCCNLRSDIEDHEAFILGNIKDNGILEIFNNEKMQELREILKFDNIQLYPCRECNFALLHNHKCKVEGAMPLSA